MLVTVLRELQKQAQSHSQRPPCAFPWPHAWAQHACLSLLILTMSGCATPLAPLPAPTMCMPMAPCPGPACMPTTIGPASAIYRQGAWTLLSQGLRLGPGADKTPARAIDSAPDGVGGHKARVRRTRDQCRSRPIELQVARANRDGQNPSWSQVKQILILRQTSGKLVSMTF